MESSDTKRKDMKMECIKCTVTLDSVAEYTEHYRTFHSGLNPHNCSMCDINLPSVAEYKNHMQQHYNKPLDSDATLDLQVTEPLDSVALDIQASDTMEKHCQQYEKTSDIIETASYSKRSAFLKASKRVKDLSSEQSDISEGTDQDSVSEYEESENYGSSEENLPVKRYRYQPIKIRVSNEKHVVSFSCKKCLSAQPSLEMSKLCCAVGPFHCFVCQSPMESKTTFMNHLKDQHQIKTVFQSYNDVVLNKQPSDKQMIEFKKDEKNDSQPVSCVSNDTRLLMGACFKKINNVGNVVIQCRICSTILPSMNVFSKHLNEHTVMKNGVSKFECKICFELKDDLSSLLKHRRDHFSMKQYPAQSEKTVNSELKKDDHIEANNDVPVKIEPLKAAGADSAYRTPCFKCTQCHTLQPSHEMAMLCCHTGSEFKCYHCDKVILTRAGLISHYNHRHNVKTSFLQSQTSALKDRDQYRDKCDEIQGVSKGRQTTHFKCKICPYKAFSLTTFKLHYHNTHQTDKNQVNVSLKSKSDTNVSTFEAFCKDPTKCKMIPTTTEHGKAKMQYYCKLCNAKFDYRSHFKHVSSIHDEDRKTRISVNKKHKINLLHMFNKVHKKVKSRNKTRIYYECKFCQKLIRRISDLSNHKKVHQRKVQEASTYQKVEDKSVHDEYVKAEIKDESSSTHDHISKDMPSFSCTRCKRKHPSNEKAVLCCKTGVLSCPICKVRCSRKVLMNQHLTQIHDVVTRWNKLLQNRSNTNASMNKRLSKNHNLAKQGHNEVSYYVVMHRNKWAYQCKICQKKCFTKKSFKVHYKLVHAKGGIVKPHGMAAIDRKLKREQIDNKQEQTLTEGPSETEVLSNQEFNQIEYKNSAIADHELKDNKMEVSVEEHSDVELIASDDELIVIKDVSGKNMEHQVRSSAKNAKNKIFKISSSGRNRKLENETYCPKCDITFEQGSELKAHIDLHDSYKLCVYCNSIRKNIYHHVQKAHSAKLVEWKMIYQRVSDTDAVVVPPEITEIVCKICNKNFACPYKYSHHVYMHKDATKCRNCKKMVNPNKISYHANKLCCKYSYQKYGYKVQTDSHQNMTSENKSTPKVKVQSYCKKCGARFQNMSDLELHYQGSNRCIQNPAPQYAKKLSQSDVGMNQDLKHGTKKRKEECRIQCAVCFKVCDNRAALKAHSTSHLERRKCDYCERKLQAGMEGHVMKFHRSKVPEWRMKHFPKEWKGKYMKNKFTYKDGRIGFRWRLKSTAPQKDVDEVSEIDVITTSNPEPLQSQFDHSLQTHIREEIQVNHLNHIQPYAHISQISSVTRPSESQELDQNVAYPIDVPKNTSEETFEEIKIELNKEFEEEDADFQPMIISVTSVKDQNDPISNEVTEATDGISTEQCNSPSVDISHDASDQETIKDDDKTEPSSPSQDVANTSVSEETNVKASDTSLTNGEINLSADNNTSSQYKIITGLLENVSSDSPLKPLKDLDDAKSTDQRKMRNDIYSTDNDKSADVDTIGASHQLEKQNFSPQIMIEEVRAHANLRDNTVTNGGVNKHTNLNDSDVMNSIYSEKRIENSLDEIGATSQCKIVNENQPPNKPTSVMLEVSSDSVLAQHNGALYECKLCKIVFLNETVHWQHMSTHATSGEPFACNHCKYTFTNAIDFHAHFISKYQKHL